MHPEVPTFAVVREDPEVELEVALKCGARRVLLLASGGCTALSLAAASPALEIDAIDANPVQLALVASKIRSLDEQDWSRVRAAFGVEDPAIPAGARASCLSQRGRFEALFAALRGWLHAFVADDAELRGAIAAGDRVAMRAWFENPWWEIAFERCFGDSVLHAMFGPAATQHAAKGSYPGYFQRAFERGLLRPDAARNPFLHHSLLGRYLPHALPDHLVHRERADRAAAPRIELRAGRIEDVRDFAPYDLVSLSNVLDWMDRAAAQRLVATLGRTLRPGAAVIYRQLNSANELDVASWLEPRFALDAELSASLLARDRSLFYERLGVAHRR